MESTQTDHKNYQEELRNLQRGVSSIYKERKAIIQEINEKSKQKKFLTSAQERANRIKQIKSETELHENPRKIVKKDSQTVEKEHTLTKEASKQANVEQTQQPKKSQKQGPIPQAIADRNRRIFGGLTKYLKKAGQHLQSKQQKEKDKNAKEILNKFISKEKQDREEVQSKKKEQLEVKLSKLEEQKNENETKINKAENEMLSFIVKSHFNAIGKFYLTRTQPQVCWKPKKPIQDQEKAEKIKQFGEKQLERQKQECLQKVMSYNEKFDHGKYMTQNQRQFYSNFINNMYLSHKSFILTKTSTGIFWKPKKAFKGLQNLLSETSQCLDQKSEAINEKNLQYYKSTHGYTIEEHHEGFDENEEDEEKNNAG